MADIMFTTIGDSNYKAILEGKNALPLDDLIKTNGDNIKKYAQYSVDQTKKLMATDALYFLLSSRNPNEDAMVAFNPLVSFFTRWDYYKERGKPEIKTTDDFIKVLSDMIKKHPTTSDGKKVYGISGWTDWGLWPFYIPMMYETGWTEYAGVIDGDGKPRTYYGKDSVFWDSLKFWYKAKKAGIVDPDSFTQKNDAWSAKSKNGQLLTVYGSWMVSPANAALQQTNKDAAFAPIPKGFMLNSAISIGTSKVGDLGRALFITKSCKNPERAMDLLDYGSSPEGSRLILSGIEGMHWDKSSGSPEFTEEYYKNKSADPDYNMKQGIGTYWILAGWQPSAISPIDNARIDLTSTEKALSRGQTAPELDFATTYGGTYPGDALNKLAEAGKMKSVAYKVKVGVVPAVNDDLTKVYATVGEYLTKNYIKAIFAKDDADFEVQKNKLIADIYKMGYGDYETEYMKNWQIAYDQHNQ